MLFSYTLEPFQQHLGNTVLLWSPFKFSVMVQITMKLQAALETILLFAQGEDEHCARVVAVAGGMLPTTAFWAGWLLLREEYNCWTSTASHRCAQLAASMLQPYLTPLPVGQGKWNSDLLAYKQMSVNVGFLFFSTNWAWSDGFTTEFLGHKWVHPHFTGCEKLKVGNSLALKKNRAGLKITFYSQNVIPLCGNTISFQEKQDLFSELYNPFTTYHVLSKL